MKQWVLTLLFVFAVLLLPPASHAQAMENLFDCTLKEGKTRSDLLKFRSEYEAAAKADGIEGYTLRVMFPIYAEAIGPGAFVWVGYFANVDVFAATSKWFQASDWPAAFDRLMTCEASSLWRVVP